MLIDPKELPGLLRSVRTQADRGILALASVARSATQKEIKAILSAAGYPEAEDWPIGSRFSGDDRVGRRAGEYYLKSKGRDWVSGFAPSSAAAIVKTREDLRQHLQKVVDTQVRDFVLEAVAAFEQGLFRSAIVMSWLAAVYVLQREVYNNHRKDFDRLMNSKSGNWKPLKTMDDFGRIKETEFLDRLADISVINKNIKAELKNCLDRRNGCGHPNSTKLTENTVAHHVDVLIGNVFCHF